jgi:formylglycine-generating enzyme required for sulfatase activity
LATDESAKFQALMKSGGKKLGEVADEVFAAATLCRKREENPAAIDWVLIEGGRFEMGNAEGEDDEKPVHWVEVPSFEMGRSEVTVFQYRQCVQAGACLEPSVSKNHSKTAWDDPRNYLQPVRNLYWEQANAFAEWTGGRLPTEAEWEFAARSRGKYPLYPWGDAVLSCDFAVISEGGLGCSRNLPWPVCSKKAGHTEQGLCDMIGNVQEWVADHYLPNYETTPTDGSAAPRPPTRSHNIRNLRGGSYRAVAKRHRATKRVQSTSHSNNSSGLRVARDVPGK